VSSTTDGSPAGPASSTTSTNDEVTESTATESSGTSKTPGESIVEATPGGDGFPIWAIVLIALVAVCCLLAIVGAVLWRRRQSDEDTYADSHTSAPSFDDDPMTYMNEGNALDRSDLTKYDTKIPELSASGMSHQYAAAPALDLDDDVNESTIDRYNRPEAKSATMAVRKDTMDLLNSNRDASMTYDIVPDLQSDGVYDSVPAERL